MADTEKTIIEVNGVKLEVDLRTARRIEEIQIGSRVKVLTKVYDGHEVHHGVVVGFEPFVTLPTIVIAYVKADWSKAEVKFIHYNAKSKDTEVVLATDEDFSLDGEKIIKQFDREIKQKLAEIEKLEEQKRYFINRFGQYYERVSLKEEAA